MARLAPQPEKREKLTFPPMTTAYAVAEGLAAAAVRTWAIDGGSTWEQRNEHVATVYNALLKASHRDDPFPKLAEHPASDVAVELMTAATDAGYLYGLAIGLAMAKGGAR